MPSIPYTNNVPNPSNYPANDVNSMQQNTNSINSIVAIDHYTFADTNAGQHKQLTMPTITSPLAQSGFSSVEYTNSGVALNTAPQLFWQNSQSIFHISPIRAWGTFDTSGNAVGNQKWNVATVTTITGVSNITYSVTLAANSVNSNNFCVFHSENYSSLATLLFPPFVSITGPGTFTVKLSTSNSPLTSLSFMVLQI
jgi:hypothetical protein